MVEEAERELVERAKTEQEAFGQLFDIHYPSILGYILKRVADPAAAQDIAAETFLKALQNIHKFEWRGLSVSNWLYKIASNELRMYFRKNKYAPRSLQQLFEQDGFEPVSPQDIHAELVEAQTIIERHQKFNEAQMILTALPVKYQEVISLRFIEKKKISEIAQILNKKDGTIKSLLSRGLARLRIQLAQEQMQPNLNNGILSSEGQILIKAQESYEE